MPDIATALAADQVAQFHREGFLAVPGFFTPREVAALQAEVRRLEQAGELRNVATAGDGSTRSATQRNLQLCPAFDHSDLVRALPFHPRVLAAVSALIGDPLVLQLDQIFLKPAGDGLGTNWHQDNAYFQVADNTKGVAMWVAIHDATVENGTLHVVPNCFDQLLPHERDPYSDHHIRCHPPEEQAVPLVLAAGGVGFFYYGTPHCTHGNHTDRDRAAVAFHFVNQTFATPDLLEPTRNYHPILTGPDADGGKAVYGRDVSRDWEALVAQRTGN